MHNTLQSVLQLQPLPASNADSKISTEVLVTVGKFDGSNPCLAYLTASTWTKASSSKSCDIAFKPILSNSDVHYQSIVSDENVRYLTAAKVLPLSYEQWNHDFLVIATDKALWLFNVHDNCDVFYIETPNGVRSVCVSNQNNNSGTFTREECPVIFAALGDYLIQGYNYKGEEIFWTMTGDFPLCLLMIDMNESGDEKLLVSSEDNQIRLFKGEECIQEVQVSSNAMLTCKLSNSSFGFLLQDGTIGITHNFVNPPLWKQTPNVPVTCIHGFNFPLDEDLESNIEVSTESLMVGYADGTLEARSATTGEVFWADGLDGTSVLAICSLPGNGADSLICVCVVLASGAVHVFNSLNKAGTVVVDTRSQLIAEIEEVLEKKYTIWSEMETAQLKLSSAPPDSFSCYFEAVYESHTDEHGCFLVITSTHGKLITGTFIEHLTEKHESSFISVEPASPSAKLKLNLPLIQISHEVKVRVLYQKEPIVQSFGALAENQQTCFSVYTQTLALPQFSLLKYTHPEKIREPLELVITFQSKLNLSEYIKWIQKDFLDTHHLLQNVSATSDTLDTRFLHIPTTTLLILSKTPTHVIIKTHPSLDSIELASQIIHSYARHFSQLTLKVSTNKAYGQVHTELKALAEKVCDLRNMIGDGRITSFDPIRQIKGLTRRVDSCWEIEDFDGAKRDLLALDELHRSLAFEHKKSLHHQTELEKTTEILQKRIAQIASLHVAASERGAMLSKWKELLLTDQVDIQSLLP